MFQINLIFQQSALAGRIAQNWNGGARAFDCKMVREYRSLHADDPSVSLANNRELILKIGTDLNKWVKTSF